MLNELRTFQPAFPVPGLNELQEVSTSLAPVQMPRFVSRLIGHFDEGFDIPEMQRLGRLTESLEVGQSSNQVFFAIFRGRPVSFRIVLHRIEPLVVGFHFRGPLDLTHVIEREMRKFAAELGE